MQHINANEMYAFYGFLAEYCDAYQHSLRVTQVCVDVANQSVVQAYSTRTKHEPQHIGGAHLCLPTK